MVKLQGADFTSLELSLFLNHKSDLSQLCISLYQYKISHPPASKFVDNMKSQIFDDGG